MNSFLTKADSIEFLFAAQGDNKAPGISIVAYNGGLLRLGNFRYPVVLDFNGVKAGAKVPFLIDHQNTTDSILGQGVIKKTDSAIIASGTITGASASAKEILETARNGHVYQASVGAIPLKSLMIDEGVKAKINGREFTGPLVHVTSSEIIEVSVVAIGADREGTEVEIAALFGLDTFVEPKKGIVKAGKELKMNPKFVEWVQAHVGLDEEALKAMSPEALTQVQAQYDSVIAAELKKKEPKAPAPKATDTDVQAQLAVMQEELRVSKIQATCGADFEDLSKKAVSENWSVDQVEATVKEVEAMRAKRPTAPGIIIRGEEGNAKTLEAAIAMSQTGMDDKALEASYGEKTLDRAGSMRNLSNKEMMHAACKIDGVDVPSLGSSPEAWAQAAFSTGTFPTVLSNVANKMLWAGYQRRESVAAAVSKKLSANDFKTHTKARIMAGGAFRKINNGGELQHGTIEDESYTYAIDTYGELLGLTRQDIINDDLGAFTVIPEHMGLDAWQLRENLFWTMVLANTGDFFGTVNGNLLTGATASVLGLTGLQNAVTVFEKYEDSKGRSLGIVPDFMLTPSELKVTAENFFNSASMITGEDATIPSRNPYSGKYAPLSTPFLSNSGITNYSASAWYLFADPAVVAAFGIAYLNGQERPVIEETALDPRYLGRTFRGYLDVGVCQIDPKGAVKSTGEAA